MHKRGIVARARRVVEQRVGGQRPARIDAVGFEPRDGGRNDRAVLFAERAVFAGVRIEPGDGEPRPRNAETAGEIARHDASGLDHELGRRGVARISRSGRWMVTGTTASSGDHSIMTGCAACRSPPAPASPRNSVCPGSAKPEL